MKLLTKARRYRLSDSTFQKLELLKNYKIVESRFVRDAINEKFERDLPEIKAKEEKIKLPF